MKSEKDIVYEIDNYWVLRIIKGFEVYQTGITHSTRVAQISYTGEQGLQRAIQEANRRAQHNCNDYLTFKVENESCGVCGFTIPF